MPKITPENWESEYRARFGFVPYPRADEKAQQAAKRDDAIKDFIHNLLSQSQEEARKEVREQILTACREQAQPYENAKWHNRLSVETIEKILNALSTSEEEKIE